MSNDLILKVFKFFHGNLFIMIFINLSCFLSLSCFIISPFFLIKKTGLDMLLEIKAPTPVITFFEIARKRWLTKINHKGENIGETRIERGLIHGNSISPILFVIAIEPLSRAIINKCTICIDFIG